MSLFQRGLGAQVSAFATRPRPINPNIRAPLRRVRQPRRHKSSDAPTTPETPAESKIGGDGVSGNASANANVSKPAQSDISTAPSAQAVNTAAAAAGAATAPGAADAVVRSRGLREIIKAGPLGRLGRWYSRVQERKPYTTQFYSSIVIYLCGDLSAQLMFPSEAPPPAKTAEKDNKATENEEEKEVSRGVGYDPWRTVRHLIVGAGSSIPSYNW
jgi:hypothetical protein